MDVSILSSGFTGSSYGSSMPVKPLIIPCLALAYKPLVSLFAHSSKTAPTTPAYPFTSTWNESTPYPTTKLHNVPPLCFLITDARNRYIYHPAYSPWVILDDWNLNGVPDSSFNAFGGATTDPFNFADAERHSQGANYLFSDGHVKWRHVTDWESGATNGLWNIP